MDHLSYKIYSLNEVSVKTGQDHFPIFLILDQGGQFTGLDFKQALKDAGIRISMDGKCRCMDNVMIERLWRSLKYECIYLHAFEMGSQARKGIGDWYNQRRPHSNLDGRTPDEAYWGLPEAGATEAAA